MSQERGEPFPEWYYAPSAAITPTTAAATAAAAAKTLTEETSLSSQHSSPIDLLKVFVSLTQQSCSRGERDRGGGEERPPQLESQPESDVW